MNLLKVDVLALGMLSALRGALALANRWRGRAWTLQDIPRAGQVAAFECVPCDPRQRRRLDAEGSAA